MAITKVANTLAIAIISEGILTIGPGSDWRATDRRFNFEMDSVRCVLNRVLLRTIKGQEGADSFLVRP